MVTFHTGMNYGENLKRSEREMMWRHSWKHLRINQAEKRVFKTHEHTQKEKHGKWTK